MSAKRDRTENFQTQSVNRVWCAIEVVAGLLLLCTSAGADGGAATLVAEQVRLVRYNASDSCQGRNLLFVFKVTGAGQHHYHFVYSDGGTKEGGQIHLSKAPRTISTDWTYSNPARDMTLWIGIVFDDGPEQHRGTYHDTCQKR